jgi:midasin (ATPase involved in ribosome maturation)
LELDINKKIKFFDEIVSKFEKQDPNLLKLYQNMKEYYVEYKSLFHWYDGPLISSMKNGEYFLIDEISLAEDAVLERLNSVLETGRSITLPEKGAEDIEEIIAKNTFQIFATMNPVKININKGRRFWKKRIISSIKK